MLRLVNNVCDTDCDDSSDRWAQRQRWLSPSERRLIESDADVWCAEGRGAQSRHATSVRQSDPGVIRTVASVLTGWTSARLVLPILAELRY